MNLCESLFKSYFHKDFGREELIEKTGLKKPGFAEYVLKTIKDVHESRDKKMLEYLIYILFIMDETLPDARRKDLPLFVSVLDELLIESWHDQHENIVTLLERISSIESLEYFFEAIDLRPSYLSWDDNYSFGVKCVRALYYVGKELSAPYLEQLCDHPNETIRAMAQKQLSKL